MPAPKPAPAPQVAAAANASSEAGDEYGGGGLGTISGIGSGGGGIGYGSGIGYGGGSRHPKEVVIDATTKPAPSGAASSTMPKFNWPPPKASAQEVIPDSFLRKGGKEVTLFSDVDTILSTALDNCGYSESSYYAVPGGFAIATRIEQINKNGIPKAGDSRWALKNSPINPFSDFSGYLNALFKGNPGYYRVIVFIITSDGFSQSTKEASKEDVEEWFSKGFNVLPSETGRQIYTGNHRCTALIYEFKKTPQKATPVIPGSLPGKTHLMRAGIWSYLKPQPPKP